MNLQPTSLNDQLLFYYNSIKRAFAWVLFFSFFINVFMLALPLYMLQVYTRILPTQSLDSLIYLTLIVMVILGIYALLSAIRSHLLIETSAWLDKQLSASVFEHMPDQVLESNEYAQQAFLDLLTMRQFISSSGVVAFSDLPWSSIYFLVIFILSPWLGLISLVVGVILFILAALNEINTKEDILKSTQQQKKNQIFIQSLARNSDILQAMGLTKNLQKKWMDNNQEALDLQNKATRKGETYLSLIRFSRAAAQVLILAVGAYLVLNNSITSGAMIAASILMSRALAPIEQSVASWKLFIQFRDAYKRLKLYLSRPPLRHAGMKLPDPVGMLSMENASFAYPGSTKYALQQISLSIPKGDLVAIIGPSASGKTTFCRLSLGILQPRTGRVKIDGADIYHRDRSEVGPHLGYLPQDIELFQGTIKENIARMGEVDPEAVVEAAKKSGAHSMILALPQGYDTKIEGLKGLSAGQMQRIALARALYKDPKVVVLDEPYSNLDHEGEQALLFALSELKRNKVTTLIISHRMDLIRQVDKILYLQEGLIKYYGLKDKVLKEMQAELEKNMQKLKGQGHGNGQPPATS